MIDIPELKGISQEFIEFEPTKIEIPELKGIENMFKMKPEYELPDMPIYEGGPTTGIAAGVARKAREEQGAEIREEYNLKPIEVLDSAFRRLMGRGLEATSMGKVIEAADVDISDMPKGRLGIEPLSREIRREKDPGFVEREKEIAERRAKVEAGEELLPSTGIEGL